MALVAVLGQLCLALLATAGAAVSSLQETSDSGRRLLRLTDRQEGIVQVLTVDDPDGSCEQFGMLSIRDREVCRTALRALGLGTTAEGHADSMLHAGRPQGDADRYRGCLVYFHASWDLYYYVFNDIGPDQNSTKSSMWPEYFTPVCLSRSPEETCHVAQGCQEGTELPSGQHCTTHCPEGQPDVPQLFCAFGNVSPANFTCVSSWEPRNASACNTSTGCVSRTVRNTSCQRWDVSRPHDFGDPVGLLPAHNFCGTPKLGNGYGPRDSDLPWCFTTDPGMQWDFCLDAPCIEGPWKDRSSRIEGGNADFAWTCRDYVSRQLCTLDGGYGPGWSADEAGKTRHGTFGDWTFMGLTAVDACCGCGGGNRNPGGCEDNPHFRDEIGNCLIRAIHRVGCDDDVVRWYCPRACGLCSLPTEPVYVLKERCEDDRHNQLSCDLFAATAAGSGQGPKCSDEALTTQLRNALGAQAPASFGHSVLDSLRAFCPFSCQACRKCGPGYFMDPARRSYDPDICQLCAPGTSQFEPRMTACWACAAGRFADRPGSVVCKRCPSGTTSELGAVNCSACPVGSVPAEESGCVPCQAGFRTDPEGLKCIPCPAGTVASLPGSATCALCPPGQYSSEGSVRCVDCEPGQAAPQSGSEACQWCTAGNYSDVHGSPVCKSCENGTTSDGRGSSSVADCICPEGTCFNVQISSCTTCPVGMSCAPGCNYSNFGTSDVHPMLQAGYMTLHAGDPLRVFRCSSTIPCPGGRPGSCAEGHAVQAVACARCAPGYSPRGQACKACEEGDTLPFVFLVCGGSALVVLATLAVNKDPIVRSNASVMVAILGGMAVSCLQSLNIYRQLEIDWFEPIRTILDAMSVLSFDLDLVNGGCVFGHDEVRKYTLQQCTVPLVLPLVLATLLCKKHFVATEVRVQFCNTVGTLFQVAFISLVVNCVVPLRCFDHPTSGSSVSAMPSILCFTEGEHTLLLLAGLASFLVLPCPFLAVSAWAAWAYPTKLLDKSPKGRAFVLSTQFLFSRFNPGAHYYCIVTLAKNCILALVPVVFQKGIALQSCLLGLAIVLFMMHQQQCLPWKSHAANQLDGLCSAALLLLLICGASASPTDSSATRDLQIVGTAIVVSLSAVLAAGLGCSIYRVCVPGKHYKWFICHHKADASAQARLLKVLLQARCPHSTVFIDSDNLVDLDTLFNVVKVQVETLVVYMTRDILTRPWCVGEIVTAFRSGTRVVRVKTSSYAVPSDEKLNDLDYLRSYLDMSGCNLARYFIRMEDVREAFAGLLRPSTPCIEFKDSLVGTPRFDVLADDLATLSIQGWKGRKNTAPFKENNDSAETEDTTDLVVISSEPGNDEATAAVSILCSKMNADVVASGTSITCLVDMDRNQFRMANCIARCRALVVLLSFGSLSSILQLHAIVELMLQLGKLESASKGKPAIIPVNLPEFQFPQAAYYEHQLPLIWGDADLQIAAEKIKSFFRFITINLPIHASDLLIETQCHEVLKRIPEESSASQAVHREPLLQDLAGVIASVRSPLRRLKGHGEEVPDDTFVPVLERYRSHGSTILEVNEVATELSSSADNADNAKTRVSL